MRNGKNEILAALISAWEELFDFKLPQLLGCRETVSANRLTAAAFIWCGIAAGAVIALTGTVIKTVFNIHIAALAFTLASLFLLSCKDSGQGDKSAASGISAMLKRCNGAENAYSAELTFLLLLLRFVLLLLLAYGGAMWYLPLLLTGAFSIQAFLAISPDAMRPLLPEGFHTRRDLVIALILIAVTGFIISPLLTLTAVAATALVYIAQSGRCRREGFSAANISRAGYIAEWSLLAAAAAFL